MFLVTVQFYYMANPNYKSNKLVTSQTMTAGSPLGVHQTTPFSYIEPSLVVASSAMSSSTMAASTRD
jgi:hypothetical protein